MQILMLACAGISFLLSCENDIEKIRGFSNTSKVPTMISTDNKFIYTDSALLRFIITTPLVHRYEEVEEPYIEFPEGIMVKHFNNQEETESIITAKYAIYYINKNLWEGRENVEAKNVQTGEQLNTEQIFWDEKKGIIYSDKFTRVVNKDGTLYGEGGFEANQNFTKWKLKKITNSSVKLEDE